MGEGDEVETRFERHVRDVDFWSSVVVFVSKDDNLTKAHVRRLEAKLVQAIKEANLAEVVNSTDPIGGKLPEADEADMETYFENIRLLLPTLGVNVFRSETMVDAAKMSKEMVLELRLEDANADCVIREGQFTFSRIQLHGQRKSIRLEATRAQ